MARTITRLLLVCLVAVGASSAAIPTYSNIHGRSALLPSSTTAPLSDWIGSMYNGLNAMRITSVTSTPLRLRATLNAFAQAQADLICNSNAPVYSSTQLIADLQSSAGITTENAEMLSIGNMLTADSVVAAWAAEKPGKTSPFSAIIYPVYVYAGFGVCNGNWVVVLTSEFE